MPGRQHEEDHVFGCPCRSARACCDRYGPSATTGWRWTWRGRWSRLGRWARLGRWWRLGLRLALRWRGWVLRWLEPWLRLRLWLRLSVLRRLQRRLLPVSELRVRLSDDRL